MNQEDKIYPRFIIYLHILLIVVFQNKSLHKYA